MDGQVQKLSGISLLNSWSEIQLKILQKSIKMGRKIIYETLNYIDQTFVVTFDAVNEALMPCPFTGHKMFCAGPNFLSLPKNLTAFSATSKTFVPAQKPILLNACHLFVWHKIFVTATICK